MPGKTAKAQGLSFGIGQHSLPVLFSRCRSKVVELHFTLGLTPRGFQAKSAYPMRRFASLALCLPVVLGLLHCNSKNQTATGGPSSSSTPTDSSAQPEASAQVSVHRPPPTREGGALVRSANDDALYLADEDHGVVRRIPLPFDPAQAYTTIPMPGLPAQVLALQDHVLLTIRSEGGVPAALPKAEDDAPATAGSAAASAKAPPKPPAKKKLPVRPKSPTGPGLLLIMKPDAAAGLVETARVALPQDAWGIAVTPDEKTVLISSAWTHQVSAVDIASAKKLWTLDVGREPRAIVVRPDGKSAYVTHLTDRGITRLDDILGQPKASPIQLPPSPLRSPSGKVLNATLAYSAVLSPEGNRLFVPRHAIGALGEAAWFGAATIDVLLTADDTPLAPMREAGYPVATSELTKRMREFNKSESLGRFPLVDYMPFSVARAAVYRKSKSTLLVVSEGSNRLVEFDARVVDPTMFVTWGLELGTDHDTLVPNPKSCSAPSGLALSADENTAWVYCRASNGIVQANLGGSARVSFGSLRSDLVRLKLEDDLLGEDYNKGRRVFYDGFDYYISGRLSCAGCHPEGRDDGHVWHETTFKARDGEGTNFLGDPDQAPFESTKAVGYPRQTPMIAGRVFAAGPYGWHGESPDLVSRLRGGFGLHRWGPLRAHDGEAPLVGRALFLSLFIRHGLIPPPREARELTPQEKKGEEVFKSEGTRCIKCHVPETEYTDRMSYPFYPKLPPVSGFEDEKEQNFKTPSLFFVNGTPPYYHDGRASTLDVLVENNGDRMGRTSHLSAEEKAALIAFLRTL